MQHVNEDVRSREREAAEMLYAGTLQALAWAPEYSPTWLACRALVPDLETRLEALGRPRPSRPEDLASTLPPA